MDEKAIFLGTDYHSVTTLHMSRHLYYKRRHHNIQQWNDNIV